MIDYFQEELGNDVARLMPLNPDHFEPLYSVANDELIWQQHPNKNRYKREVFDNFFVGAIQSKGAYIIYDNQTNAIAGSSRFYDFNEDDSSIFIGYTFFARNYWGTGFNHGVKNLMLDHAFKKVNKVYFHVGIDNKRSLIAMDRLGGKRVREVEVAYFGEPSRINVEFVMMKEDLS
jgi:RimJ/RimL family protein N-acetyltransferase